MCEICKDLSSHDTYSRWIQLSENWYLAPTLGYFRRGYALLVPYTHVSAVGALEERYRSEGLKVLESVRPALEARFGPTVLAEHGSAGFCVAPGAACCDHAHLHLIPLDRVEQRSDVLKLYYEISESQPIELASLDDLASVAAPYIYLSPDADRHFVWRPEGFPRQWVRKAVGKVLGIDAWDWRQHPFEAELRSDTGLFHDMFGGRYCG